MIFKNPTQRFRARLKTLNDRADYLQDKKRNDYERQELAAIRWAINVIQDFPDEALRVIRYEDERGRTDQPDNREVSS